jgi:hypothetical protein
MNKNVIDAYIRFSPEEPMWRLTCVYGEPRVENRHQFWSKLQDLKSQSDLPWLVLGDFNEALWQFEHFSRVPRAENQMMAFLDTLQICGLSDLGFIGLPYTYDNKRQGHNNVKVRLDRAVADRTWRNLYSEAEVNHIITPCSEHLMILVKFQQEQRMPPRHIVTTI